MSYFPSGYGPQNPYMGSSFHLRRDINLVLTADKQAIVFVNEMLQKPATTPYSIYNGGGDLIYQNATYQPFYSERTLLWGRESNGWFVSGMRWVPWYHGPRGCPVTDEVYPFREIYCPTVVFDADRNVIHLWFWTNAKGISSISTYKDIWDDKQVFHGNDIDAIRVIANTPDVSRVLCYAMGEFVQGRIVGGLVFNESCYEPGDESAGITMAGFQNDAQDLIPVFCEPKLISLDLTIQTAVVSPDYQGPLGFQGVQGYGVMGDCLPIAGRYHTWDGFQSPFFPAQIVSGTFPNHVVDIYDNGKQGAVTRPGTTMMVPDGQFVTLPVGTWIIGMQTMIV